MQKRRQYCFLGVRSKTPRGLYFSAPWERAPGQFAADSTKTRKGLTQMITLTKPVFEKLIEHLIKIEETSDILADFYFPDSPKDQEELSEFFTVYVKKIENELQNADVINPFIKVKDPGVLNAFPFVTIGSEVGLEILPAKTARICRVIFPDSQANVKNGVSFLSQLGRSLLLRNCGTVISMGVDGGNSGIADNSGASVPDRRAVIKSIRLMA